MMRDLSHVGEYAKLDNTAFRLLKTILPGAYTFILEGVRDIPSRLLHPKKKTIGLRISGYGVVQELLKELGEPIMSVSLIIEGHEFFNIYDVCSAVDTKVDIIIDSGFCPPEPTSVIDFSSGTVEVTRYGAGDTSLIDQ
jgi:tRNA threonylcarbamoyl adenosine modification protein (Sua5/YciO/YrdC/YwlC family)